MIEFLVYFILKIIEIWLSSYLSKFREIWIYYRKFMENFRNTYTKMSINI